MNCALHPDAPAVAYCRSCGKALCAACQRTAQGTVFCEEHMPAPTIDAAPSPYTAPPTATAAPLYTPNLGVSPGLAFLLGFIPGVGAIYNAQYGKGLIHGLVVGLLISILSSGAAGNGQPAIAILLAAFFPYMAFEAYHTARKRQLGQPVDEFSSLAPMGGRNRFPVAPVVLIALGVLFLLINFDFLRFYEIVRYWPVFLIALGVYMLYARLMGPGAAPAVGEVSDERR